MQKTTTPVIQKEKSNVAKAQGPRLSTISYLKQFARVYGICGLACPGLNGFIMN